MVVDSSAIIAMLLGEPEADAFASAISKSSNALLSAGNYIEAVMVLSNKLSDRSLAELDLLMIKLEIIVTPVTLAQAEFARDAFLKYGKGRHRAGLNLGDCFAYALAKETGELLLFKGDDFSQTDISPAPY